MSVPGQDRARSRGPQADDQVILCPRGLFLYWWDGDARRDRQRLAEPELLISGWTNPFEVEGATVGDLLHG